MTTRNPEFLPVELTSLHADSWTWPFWEAAASHHLKAPRCTSCQEFRFPPAPVCWNCRASEVDWVELPGTGVIFTFTVTRKPLLPALSDVVPYVTVVVDVDEAPGVRLVAQLVGQDPETVQIGQSVRVEWDDIREDLTIPRFTPAD
ncbi:Zn-ribbon domain-containing OB-fold protein [Rhodococcus wratislaviensis]|uniref:DUF35 domain-containing protein n=1 Tax=Rhodococcus wratislaviensis NBRC 100605 TaxID=1219028 RepID=X0PZ09_RHOWR|nr:OB-fold domain-containing protein [Rhodococcus wratislaviensis]GAF48889.1 hypothetical protein RW1_062_00130 [Rhodococcus wratislaviensis NBRC 100605]